MADILRNTCGVSFRPTTPTATPPAPTGRQLAAIPRGRARELRLALDSSEGEQFVSVRVWRRDRFGAWWPAPGRGSSIRLGELGATIGALQLAANMVELDPVEG